MPAALLVVQNRKVAGDQLAAFLAAFAEQPIEALEAVGLLLGARFLFVRLPLVLGAARGPLRALHADVLLSLERSLALEAAERLHLDTCCCFADN